MPLKHAKRQDYERFFHYKKKDASFKKPITRYITLDKPEPEQKTL